MSRKYDSPPVTLKKSPYYELVTPDIPKGVIVNEDMLGRVSQLKYVEHDIIDTTKFPELAPHHYLELIKDVAMNQRISVPKVWERGLEQEGILNLFDIPHFGQSNEVNACVNFLLNYVHGGYLWLDKPMLIYTYLIVGIKSLPTQGKDQNSLFAYKKTNMTLSKAMRENFHTARGVCGLDVTAI
jgi:hypothetical protein